MLAVHIDRKIKDFKLDSQGVLMLNKFKENKRSKGLYLLWITQFLLLAKFPFFHNHERKWLQKEWDSMSNI